MMAAADTNMVKISSRNVDIMAKKIPQVEANSRSGGNLATIVRHAAANLPPSRRHNRLWCFCEFCGRQTEYAVAIEDVGVFKRIKGGKGGAAAVRWTEAMQLEAKNVADEIAGWYEEAAAGIHGPFAIGQLLAAYCDVSQMDGDYSVNSFRLQIELGVERDIWRSHGDMYGSVRLPTLQREEMRPSKRFCDRHQPKRSPATRRAYQRDRTFAAEYQRFIDVLWAAHAGQLQPWNTDHQTLIRDAAYHAVRIWKSTTPILDECTEFKMHAQPSSRKETIDQHYYEKARAAYHRLRKMREPRDWVDDLQEQGIDNQSELARRFGITRQAVSVAISRRRIKQQP